MRNISGRPMAMATVRGDRQTPMLKGIVRFYQRPYGVLIEADIIGLPGNKSGFFGFHIHDGAFCAGEGYPTTGGHYDLHKQPHPQHAGDLPPLLSYGGRAYLAVVTDRFSIRDILGRTVVIHSDPDDFRTQPAGNAGTKIGCGVITRT